MAWSPEKIISLKMDSSLREKTGTLHLVYSRRGVDGEDSSVNRG